MSFRRKKVKSGGPSAKSNQQVYCSHCSEAGKKEVESCVLKKNMTKHMKRFHMMLDPKNDQAWMLSWQRQDRRSTVRSFFQQVPARQVRQFPATTPKPIKGGERNDEDEKKAIYEDCEVTEVPQAAKISENEGKRIHKKTYQVEDRLVE